jgi:hypothetical protein
LAVQAAAVGAQVPPTRMPEQHSDALLDGRPFTTQAAPPLGGVDEAQAVNSVPDAQALPL